MLRHVIVFALLLVVKVCGSSDDYEFGHNMRQYFAFEDGWTNMNYGAYGGTPLPILKKQFAYIHTMEQQISEWMNGKTGYRYLIQGVRAQLAEYINVDTEDVVLVDNASNAINLLLNTWPDVFFHSEEKNKFLIFSTAYGPFVGFYDWFNATKGIDYIEVDIKFPLAYGDQDVLDPWYEALEENHEQIAVCVFSHVASYPGIILPVKELTQACHKYDIPVIIDGAHALGSLPYESVDMQDIQPDFWFGNAHKWMMSPKSGCLLYVNPNFQLDHWPEPTVIDTVGDAFTDRFVWDGTRDRSPFCAIADALEWREEIGGEEAIQTYNHDLAIWAGQYLSELWETTTMAPDYMHGQMINVVLPTNNMTLCGQFNSAVNAGGFYCGYGSIPAELTVSGEPLCFYRLSAQVYVAKQDFIDIGDLVMKAKADAAALE